MTPTVLAAAGLLTAAVVVWPRSSPVQASAVRAVVARAAAARVVNVRSDPGRLRAQRRARADPTVVLLQILEAVAAQVHGGAVPTVAWDAAVEVLGAPAAHLPRARGAPLADALRQLPGGDRIVLSVAAAWSLADDVGAPLADVLDQLAAGLRHEADVDAEIEASLAGPRATARLLAVLPVAGVGLGELIGAGPVHVLVGTPVGRLSGLGGLALALGGHLWTRRLVARAAATT